jgi:hypothetical protein
MKITKKLTVILITVILLLSINATSMYVESTGTGSASCNGASYPLAALCTLSDAFNFLDNSISPVLGAIVHLNDTFHFVANTLQPILGPIERVTDSFHLFGNVPTITLGQYLKLPPDIFHFVDNPIFIVTGILEHFTDSFHLTDKGYILLGQIFRVHVGSNFNLVDSVTVSIKNTGPNNNSPPSNPYETTTGQQLVVSQSTSLIYFMITGFILPMIYIMAIILITMMIGVKNFFIILPIGTFVFLGLIWIKVFPSYSVILPILVGSAILTLFVSKWMSTRSQSADG